MVEKGLGRWNVQTIDTISLSSHQDFGLNTIIVYMPICNFINNKKNRRLDQYPAFCFANL